MSNTKEKKGEVIQFPQPESMKSKKSRKKGLNTNKSGSVRNMNGKVYVDFMYMDERVREHAGLPWNQKNAKHVRGQLDKIHIAIESGTFKFAEVFPQSKKTVYFSERENQLHGTKQSSETVRFEEFVWTWYELLKASERVTERTLCGYKSYISNYLEPFFGKMMFADINKSTCDKFVAWAKKRKLRNKPVCNKTVNKILVPMKMICSDAAIEYDWGVAYNPFWGFKKLPEEDSYEKLSPFSIKDQISLLQVLDAHWQPFFEVAFKIGLRQGEQIALKPEDINWSKGILTVKRAVTKNEDGKFMMGKTKNKYSRRTITLLPMMLDALKNQKKIYNLFQGEFFFCSPQGNMVNTNYLRKNAWKPALEKADLQYREMKQTRHSFATNALSCGENPLWIARVMGHRDTDMIMKVFSNFIEVANGFQDGNNLNSFYQEISVT
jgi:integrase